MYKNSHFRPPIEIVLGETLLSIQYTGGPVGHRQGSITVLIFNL